MFVSSVFASGTAAAAGAHQHGVAQMQVAVEGNGLTLEFISPMENLVGFEHAPRTDKQRQALQSMKDRFARPDSLIVPSAAAGCKAAPAELDLPDHRHAGHDHADLHAAVTFRCESPAALKGIELRLFEAFPRLRTVKIELVAPGGQSAASLTPQRRSLRW